MKQQEWQTTLFGIDSLCSKLCPSLGMRTWSSSLALRSTVDRCEHVMCTTGPNQLFHIPNIDLVYAWLVHICCGYSEYCLKKAKTDETTPHCWQLRHLAFQDCSWPSSVLAEWPAAVMWLDLKRSYFRIFIPKHRARFRFFFFKNIFLCVHVWGTHLLVLLRPKNRTISKHCFLNAVCYV